eukprot:6061176-Amphidinium_carterae.1
MFKVIFELSSPWGSGGFTTPDVKQGDKNLILPSRTVCKCEVSPVLLVIFLPVRIPSLNLMVRKLQKICFSMWAGFGDFSLTNLPLTVTVT